MQTRSTNRSTATFSCMLSVKHYRSSNPINLYLRHCLLFCIIDFSFLYPFLDLRSNLEDVCSTGPAAATNISHSQVQPFRYISFKWCADLFSRPPEVVTLQTKQCKSEEAQQVIKYQHDIEAYRFGLSCKNAVKLPLLNNP